MKLWRFVFILTIISTISCNSVYIESSELVQKIIDYPEKYKEIIKDTNNVSEKFQYSENFEKELFYISQNKLKLISRDKYIYDGIKYIKLEFYNPKKMII